MGELIFRDEGYAIVGAAMEVHKQLGPGFLEPVYQEAFPIEFAARDIPFEPEVEMQIAYKDRLLEKKYRADFVCFGKIVVELKALPRLGGTEAAQIINYLRASHLKVGVLLNLGRPSLEWKRFVC